MGNLSHRYSGLFEVLNDVGSEAYTLAFPPILSGVHPVFYVSILKRYHGDVDYIFNWDSVLLDKNFFVERETDYNS